MPDKDLAALQQELGQLRARVAQLESEVAAAPPLKTDYTRGYYLTYYATTGFFLGIVGALSSLLFNVVGSMLVGKHPLQLIRVYLTFGMAERALDVKLDKDGGMFLIIGCCLYVATGMLLGVLFQVVLSRTDDPQAPWRRFLVATGLGLAVWVVNFYVLIAQIQPRLFGGNWIVDEIPWWVAALTHLVFAWTMALVYPLGKYEPYRPRTEQS